MIVGTFYQDNIFIGGGHLPVVCLINHILIVVSA